MLQVAPLNGADPTFVRATRRLEVDDFDEDLIFFCSICNYACVIGTEDGENPPVIPIVETYDQYESSVRMSLNAKLFEFEE